MLALLYVLKGISIGFSIAAPIGPVGVLCIRRTLQKGKTSGFISGLGASSASLLYGVTLLFGFSLFSELMSKCQFWLRLAGGLFLIYLGCRILFTKFSIKPKEKTSYNLLNDYFTTFIINLTNPITLISYFAIFSSYGFEEGEGVTAFTSFLLLGIFLGSAIWWAILSNGISYFKSKLNQEALRWINRIAGSIVIGFGVLSLPLASQSNVPQAKSPKPITIKAATRLTQTITCPVIFLRK